MDDVKLKPTKEEKKQYLNIPESEAQYIMKQISDICIIHQSITDLPETTRMEKSAIFYIEEVIKVLIDHGFLTS